MSKPKIGTATVSSGELTQDNGVAFRIPYGAISYDILLKDDELDSLLQTGFEKLLGENALAGYEYEIELAPLEQPLLVGVRSISATRRNIFMETSIVTRSQVHDHRGILSVTRNLSRPWELTDYHPLPPLLELPEQR